jgi:hypothetical protein
MQSGCSFNEYQTIMDWSWFWFYKKGTKKPDLTEPEGTNNCQQWDKLTSICEQYV